MFAAWPRVRCKRLGRVPVTRATAARTKLRWNFDAAAVPSGARSWRHVSSLMICRPVWPRAGLDPRAAGFPVRRWFELLVTWEIPVLGILTVLVVRPVADFVTRNGPAPTLAPKPRFDAVIRTGPKLFDLR